MHLLVFKLAIKTLRRSRHRLAPRLGDIAAADTAATEAAAGCPMALAAKMIFEGRGLEFLVDHLGAIDVIGHDQRAVDRLLNDPVIVRTEPSE